MSAYATADEAPHEYLGETDPNLIDTGSIVQFYVVHKVTPGSVGSEFRIEAPTGWVRLAATPQFPVAIGDVDDGISVGYGSCLTGSIHVITLMYTAPGNTPPGEMFKILSHLDRQGDAINVVDCNSTLLDDTIGEETPVTVPE